MVQTLDDLRVEESLRKHADMIQRICFLHLRNREDVEDVFQEVFMKYISRNEVFTSDEHEKAWLIRVAVNQCKDLAKSFWRRNKVSIEGMDFAFQKEEESVCLEAVLSLPSKYKDAIYLHYYEGYSVPELSKILNQKENTIYSNLHRGRAELKNKLGEDVFGQSF